MPTQTIKAGTRIETFGSRPMAGWPGVPPERAKVLRWKKENGPIPNQISATSGGWHIVEFDNGGKLAMHETNFRIISN